jgi:hypothetical protein
VPEQLEEAGENELRVPSRALEGRGLAWQACWDA